MEDPDFGPLLFMPISKHPERSYWECEWKFPPTGEKVFISLRGIESGPAPDVRKFYLSLPGRFPEILAVCRPGLEQVFNEWLNRRLPAEMFSDLKLSGFGVEVPFIQPIHWDVSF